MMNSEDICRAAKASLKQLDKFYPDVTPRGMEDYEKRDLASTVYLKYRIAHYKWMCVMIPKFLAEGTRSKRDKAMRWLCFVQGALYELNITSIEQFKLANRPAADAE